MFAKIKDNFFPIFKLVTGLIIFLGLGSATVLIADPDFWWHLKVGEWIVHNNAVPHYDIYSHTMPGFEWFDHEWLVEALMWKLYAGGFLWAVFLIFTLASFIPFFFWLKRAHSFFQVWCVVLVAAAMLPFIGLRPQVFSFALFFVVFEILRKRYEKDSAFAPAVFFALPFIFFIWANLHAGFFSGLALFGIFIFGDRFIAWWRKKQIVSRELLRDIFVAAASFAATFINPYGWKVYQLTFEALVSHETMRYIAEWRPVFSSNNISFLFIISLFVFFAVRYRKKFHFPLLIAGVSFFILFIKSVKMGPMFFMIAFPMLARTEEFFRDEISPVLRNHPFTEETKEKLKAGAVLLFFCIFFLLGTNIKPYIMAFERDSIFKLPTSAYFPEKAITVLREDSEIHDGNLLNAYGWGGYVIFHAPEIKVFVDGRMPHWIDKRSGNSAMRDFVTVSYGANGGDWKEVLKRRKITTILFGNPKKPEKSIVTKIFSEEKNDTKNIFSKEVLVDNGWVVAHEDEIAIILRCPQGTCWK